MNLNTFKAKWLAPLIFFEIYLTATVLLFFFGPWEWGVKAPLQLASYLVTAQVFVGLGYLLGWRSIRRLHRTNITEVKQVDFGIVYLKFAVIVTFILLIPTSISRTGELLPNIFTGINDPGAAYNQNFARLENGNPLVIAEYLRMLLSPLLVAVYPLSIVYWSRLSRTLRFSCFVAIMFNLSLYLATGTNKGLADFVITLPWLMFLGISSGALKLRINRATFFTGFAVLFASLMYFFGRGQTQREGGVGELGIFNNGNDIIQANADNFVSQFFSRDLQIIYESLTRYLGQGYYALSMSFNIDHNSTLGFGNSIFLARNADAFFGTNNFTSGSIPGLLEDQTGWGMYALWHSIYPWLASDFGFTGALFILGMLSYLFALSWGRSLITLAPQWVVLSFLFLILFFYIPANNQVFQSGETCLAFIFLLFGAKFLRKIIQTSMTFIRQLYK